MKPLFILHFRIGKLVLLQHVLQCIHFVALVYNFGVTILNSQNIVLSHIGIAFCSVHSYMMRYDKTHSSRFNTLCFGFYNKITR